MNERPGGEQGPGAGDDQWRPVDPPPENQNPYPPTQQFDPNHYGPPPQYGGPSTQQYAGPPPGQYGGPPPGQYGGSPPGQYGAFGPPTQQFGQNEQYPQYGAPPPQYGAPDPAWATAGGPPPSNSNRTLWLIAAVVALLVVVALVVGYFVVNGSDSTDDTTAASQPSATLDTTDDLIPQLPGGPFPSDDSSPSASAAPGQILYRITGDGQLLGLTYSAGQTFKITPRLITPPWSVAVDVSVTPSLTAVVLQGQLTCTISLDGKVLTTSTSSTGLLRCEAPAN